MTTPLIETESSPDAGKLLLVALEERWEKYRTELKRCRDEFSNEAVHDLRVAARRMLALIKLLNSIDPHPRLKKLSRAFKDQLDEFDELRDTQVILAELSEIMQELPQLQDFQKYLQSSEERLLRELRKTVKHLETSEITKRIRKTQEAIEDGENDELESQILQAVDDAFLHVRQRLSNVDFAHPATIHRVRVAFKSFRYMVEIASPLLPGFPEQNFKRMNDYQSLMGEIQDAEVFTQTLSDFIRRLALSNPAPVRRYEEQRHADVLSAFKKKMQKLDTFWRVSPEQPFPWEKPE
ncbi:MAG: CHAD domain-containing protein [Anaerolineales bacterium]